MKQTASVKQISISYNETIFKCFLILGIINLIIKTGELG